MSDLETKHVCRGCDACLGHLGRVGACGVGHGTGTVRTERVEVMTVREYAVCQSCGARLEGGHFAVRDDAGGVSGHAYSCPRCSERWVLPGVYPRLLQVEVESA